MKKIFFALLFFCNPLFHFAQAPKLIVGIVIDQMRWDYIYRYQNRYAETGAFKTFLKQGFSCDNVFIPYIPTITACGHASIYTGTTPAIHGIIGNEWFDRKKKEIITSVSSDSKGKSPKNMWATTIGDQLRLSNLFKSRTYSISLKDRGAILPGGQTCNAAFWWDSHVGNWTTSAYYQQVPSWFAKDNVKNIVDSIYLLNWAPLYPIATYTNSTTDVQIFEQGLLKKESSAFNYQLADLIDKDYKTIMTTPYGITLTIDFAKKIIQKERLGFNQYQVPDMLTLSFSSTDLIGHYYGPQSIEIEDAYLRLDRYLGDFINFLDTLVGRNNYLLFLTADHGVSPIPEFLEANQISAGRYSESKELKEMNAMLKEKFQTDNLIWSFINGQVYVNNDSIQKNSLDREKIIASIIQHYEKQDNILYVFETKKYVNYPMPSEIKEQFAKGYNVKISGDVQLIYKPFYISSYVDGKGTTHGAWNSYDAHIPLLWLGKNIPNGKTSKKYRMTDIAATVSSLLNIEVPSSSIGDVIQEVQNPQP